MRTTATTIVALALVAGAATVTAQQTAAPATFRFERPIVTSGSGPRRLAIDVPLLAAASPFRTTVRSRDPETGARSVILSGGLRDLRLYDAGGSEIGYLLIGGPLPEPIYTNATILPVLSVDDKKIKTSGFEADLGEPLTIDRFRVEGIAAPFLKRVRLEGSGDRQHWTTLVADGTLFDLPDERLRQIELRFAPGTFRYLRLTWDDSHSARVSSTPAAAAGRLPQSAAAPPLTTALVFERRASEPGFSRFRISLPAGHLPIVALDLDVPASPASGGHILRQARVFQPQLTGTELVPRLLGQSTLRRVVRDDVAASALRLPMDPPTEAQLDLEIEDGDNPPLDLRGVTAVFADLPWIYVEAPASGLTARYGNTTLATPRYDIEAERDRIQIHTVPQAAWGEPRARAEAENAPGVAPPLPTFGASLDTSAFKYVRTVAAGSAGLIAVAFDANTLAHSTGPARRFSDVRVVDDADRQIPYLIEQLPEPLSIAVPFEKLGSVPKTLPPARSGRSVYRLTFPVEGLPPARLVIATSARVFDRRITVGEERERDERRRDPWFDMMAIVEWRHADQDRPAAPLTITLRTPHDTSLLVVVDEGDNAPLPIDKAQLLLPSYRIRLYRGTGTPLRVAYGRSDLPRPQYDLALLTPQVLGAPAREVTLDGERPVSAVAADASIVSPSLFWAALAIAVIALVAIIVRLLKNEA